MRKSVIGEFFNPSGKSQEVFRERPEELEHAQVMNSIVPFQYVTILGLSAIIGTIGLAADSAVVIIGAMLIAPLMKPIISLSYGVVIGDWPLKARAIITLCLGALATIAVSYLVEQILGLYEPTNEILSRIRPSLLDLGIAISAGVAATLAATRKNVMDAIPGVAIAVSLVPPLSVVGIGLSIGEPVITFGALLLFLVNLTAIVLTSVLVFLMEGFGTLRRSFRGLVIILIAGAFQFSPLDDALKTLKADDQAQTIIENYLHRQYPIDGLVHPNDLERLITYVYPDHLFVFLEIKSDEQRFTNEHSNEMHKELEKAFKQKVNLKVQVLDSKEFLKYSKLLRNGGIPNYGDEDLIPRR
jgi:uncharacterized hydrophobic protein (TIGR00271 family)